MHGDQVAGGDAVHVPGRHGANHNAGHTQEMEHEVKKAGTSRGAAIVKYIHQNGYR